MFIKLLKYDLRPMYRYLVFFYILSIICAAAGRFFSILPDNFINIFLSEFLIGAGAIGLPIGMVINNAMHLWEITRQNFYGDQSYLRHTLPVSTFQIYCSKFITALLTTLTTFLVIVCAVLIAYGSSSFFDYFRLLAQDLGLSTFIRYTIELTLLIYLEFIFIIQVGITGIILGHRFNNHKLILSIACGFGIYYFCNMLTLALAAICSLFIPELHDALFGNVFSLTVFNPILAASLIVYTVYIGVQFWLSTKLLKRGVNVD